MGLYSDYIFPHLLELLLGGQRPTEYRQQLLADAHGDVLEIGFGTGLNLPHYPAAVEQLTLVDPAHLLAKRVQKRIAAARMPISTAYLDAQRLPFENDRFDTVVSTWTLCTIPDAAAALAEIRRVLSPTGRLLFLEHGRSENERTARRQDRWNWLQKKIGCGCNLNRPIDRLIEDAGLKIQQLERFDVPGEPAIIAPHYLGTATC